MLLLVPIPCSLSREEEGRRYGGQVLFNLHEHSEVKALPAEVAFS